MELFLSIIFNAAKYQLLIHKNLKILSLVFQYLSSFTVKLLLKATGDAKYNFDFLKTWNYVEQNTFLQVSVKMLGKKIVNSTSGFIISDWDWLNYWGRTLFEY